MTIYVDEAGNANYRAPTPKEPLRAYVPCAVAVHARTADHLLSILPRGPSGQLLKENTPEMTDDARCAFLRTLLQTDVEVAALQIDPGGAQSIAAAMNNTALVNKRRSDAHHRHVTPQQLTYTLFVPRVIIDAVHQLLTHTGSSPTFFDVVLDEANLGRTHEEQFREIITKGAEQFGVRVADVRWAADQEEDPRRPRPRAAHRAYEPLLLLPDIVAGIVWRRSMLRLAPRVFKLLDEAERAGRILIRDGYRIPDIPASGSQPGQSAS